MNKTARTAKVYAISLSLIFLANVLFLQGNNSIISIQVAQSQDSDIKNPIVIVHAGERRNLTANSNTSNGDSVTYTWVQERGPDVLDGKNSFIGQVLQIAPDPALEDKLVVLNVTAISGLAKSSDRYYVWVPRDFPPNYDVDSDQTIETQEYCKSSNSSQPGKIPEFDLKVFNSSSDYKNLTFFWSTVNHQSMINIKDPHSANTTFTVKNLCNQVGQMNVIFMMKATDISNQSVFKPLVYTIQPAIKDLTITID